MTPGSSPAIRVRVKSGVRDPDFPDTPLDGWVGTIEEINPEAQPPLYLIAWDRATLDALPADYRRRCEEEDLDLETMWLAANDLELETGEPLPSPPPRQFRENDPEDRVRAVFGLTGNEPLPPVNADTQRRYHEHLAARLRFPLVALCTESVGRFRQRTFPVVVLRLLPPEEADPDLGLLVQAIDSEESAALPPPGGEGVTPENLARPLPLAALELAENDSARRLVGDYLTWLEMAEDDASLPPVRGMTPPSLWGLAFTFLVGGAAGGALVKAVLETVEGAQIGVAGAAAVLGFLGALLGRRYGTFFGAVNRIRLGGAFGMVGGALVGGVVGAVVGALIVAFVGSILGSIAGTVLGRVLKSLGARPMGEVGWVLLGAWAGSLVLAWYKGPERFLPAVLVGAGLGALVLLLLMVVFLLVLTVLTAMRR